VKSADALSDFLDWLNSRFGKGGTPIEEDTLLFEDGRIDSMGVLNLVAWVESVSGATIPDRLIRIDHFETPAAIVERFLGSRSEAER